MNSSADATVSGRLRSVVQREGTCRSKLPSPVETKQMPVLLPNRGLSECFFKVNLSEEGVASEVLRYFDGTVYCGVTKSDRLWVNVFINAKVARG